jgi:hypothetical protein
VGPSVKALGAGRVNPLPREERATSATLVHRQESDTMRRITLARVAAAIAAFSLLLGAWNPPASETKGEPRQQAGGAPKFQLDPPWPKPLPDRWVTGDVRGTYVVRRFRRPCVRRVQEQPYKKSRGLPRRHHRSLNSIRKLGSLIRGGTGRQCPTGSTAALWVTRARAPG